MVDAQSASDVRNIYATNSSSYHDWLDKSPAFATNANSTSLLSASPHLADILWTYVGPTIFAVGMGGNILVLLVMSQRRMRGTTTCVYLQWMAVTDLLVLVTGMIPEWLQARYHFYIRDVHPALCKLEKFVFYSSSDTSIWICVIFTVDR